MGKFAKDAVFFLLGVCLGMVVATKVLAVETEDNYENKIVDVQEIKLKNGCTVVEITTEDKHGDNTTVTQEKERWVACPGGDANND